MIEELEAIERIKQLKARYFRCIDTKNWAGLSAVFASDASLTVGRPMDPVEQPVEPAAIGREQVVQFIRSRGEPVARKTVHHGHMPEIELDSTTTARGIWAMEDIVETPEQTYSGHGHYHETYRVEDGQWRITSLRLTRLRVVTWTRG